MDDEQRSWSGAARRLAPIIIGVLVVAAIVWFQTADRRAPADRAEMYRHRLSLITDDQIRAVYEQAIIESAARSAQRAEQQVSSWNERCDDVAYRARNRSECSAPILGLGMQMPSERPDSVFEEMVLGVCAFASSRHAAKELGCLP